MDSKIKRRSVFIFCAAFLLFSSLSYSASSNTNTNNAAASNSTEGGSSGSENNSQENQGPSFGVGFVSSQEEASPVEDIEVEGEEVKEVNFKGVKLRGKFVEESPGVYVAKGEIKPDWNFDISLGAAGRLVFDTNSKKITGQAYVNLPVFGKILQVTDIILSKTQIKFKGVFQEGISFTDSLRLDTCQGIADFEISKKRISVQAYGGVTLSFSGIPKAGTLEIELLSGSAGFGVDIPPQGIELSGSGTVTIPFEPPIKVNLAGTVVIKKSSISGSGSGTVFEIIEIAQGNFEINSQGIMSVNGQVGAEIGNLLDISLAKGLLRIDLPQQTIGFKLKQEAKILNGLITIPGSNGLDFLLDHKAKTITISGKAGFPLIPQMMLAPDALSVGLKNGRLNIYHYNTSPQVELGGDLYISQWTLGGFSGEISGSSLSGAGSLGLPPGLKEFLGIEKLNFPLSVDLHSLATLGDVGADLGSLYIKHFPLLGPKLTIKKDGIHFSGQISIKNVITLPLGDLVFTKNEKYTSFSGDITLGPFTIAQGNFSLPESDSGPISFSGNVSLLGNQVSLGGKIYNSGEVELGSLAKIGFFSFSAQEKAAVSSRKISFSQASLSASLGGVSSCSLSFNNLDLSTSALSGEAEVSFESVVGINKSFSGSFSFDGHEATITVPRALSLCGIVVKDVEFDITAVGLSGSGKITTESGKSINVSISIKNGLLELKNPAGEIIATGWNIAKDFANIISNTAKKEKKIVSEDADRALDNLSRMSQPWVRDFTAVASAAKNFYSSLASLIKDRLLSQLSSLLNNLENKINSAVNFVKQKADELVDGFCDALEDLATDVKNIFPQIDSLIPSSYRSEYNSFKSGVISAADTLKNQVETFRTSAKQALYNTTGVITALYQTAIDTITNEANAIADSIKAQIEPIIWEIDTQLVEVEREIDAASSAVGNEAKQHINKAKQIGTSIKNKASNIINNYKNKLTQILSPYVSALKNKISPYIDKVDELKNQVADGLVSAFMQVKSQIDPYLNPLQEKLSSLEDKMEEIGGEALKKFNQLLKSTGDAFNSAVGTLGKGLVKATDILGDAFVAATSALASVSQTVNEAIHQTAEAVQQTAEVVVETAQEAASAASNAAAEIAATASQAYQETQQAVTTAYQQAYNTASSAVSQAEDTITSAASSVSSQASSVVSSVASSVYNAGSASSDSSAASVINDIVSTATGYASSAYQTAQNAASTAAGAASEAISSAWNKVSSWAGGGSSENEEEEVPDYTAPEITNVKITNVTTNSFSVSWDTSFASTTIVLYAESSDITPSGGGVNRKSYIKKSSGQMVEEKHHTATITGLSSGKTYYFLVYSYHRINSNNTTDAKYTGPIPVTTLPTTALIGGTIKDSQGSPLSDVSIFVNGQKEAVSLEDGKYALEVDPGSYTIKAAKENFITAQSTTPNLAAGNVLSLDFTLASGKIKISGSVKDKNGSPLGGVKITTSTSQGPFSYTTTSGAFSFSLPMPQGGNFTSPLVFHKDGFVDFIQNVDLPPGAEINNLNITLYHTPPQVSDVQVGDINGGATAKSIFYKTSQKTDSFIQFGKISEGYAYQTSVVSNQNVFNVSLEGLAPGTNYKYRIVVKNETGNFVSVYNGTFHTVSLGNLGQFKLCVYDPQTLMPVSGARVDIDATFYPFDSFSLPTDAQGCIFASSLKTGKWNVNVGDFEGTFPSYLGEASFSINIQGEKLLSKTMPLPLDLDAQEFSLGLFSLSKENLQENVVQIKVNSPWRLKYNLELKIQGNMSTKTILSQDLGIKRGNFNFKLTGLRSGRSYQLILTGQLLAAGNSGQVLKEETKTLSFSVYPPLPRLALFLTPNLASKGEKVKATMKIFPSQWDNSLVDIKLYCDKELVWEKKKILTAGVWDVNSVEFTPPEGRHTITLGVKDMYNRHVIKTADLEVISFPRPHLSFDKETQRSNTLEVGKPKEFKFILNNTRDICREPLVYYIDWGDGSSGKGKVKLAGCKEEGGRITFGSKKEEKKEGELYFVLKHTYKKPLAANVKVSVIDERTNLKSNTLSNIFYVWPPTPIKELSVSTSGLQADFKIKIESPYFKVGKWKLEFGDKQSISGQGEADKIISHKYKRRGKMTLSSTQSKKEHYLAKLTVERQGESLPKTFSKTIRVEITPPSLSSHNRGSSLLKRSGGRKVSLHLGASEGQASSASRLSLKIVVPPQIYLKEEQKIKVQVVSPQETEGNLKLFASGRLIKNLEVKLKTGENVFSSSYEPERKGEVLFRAVFVSEREKEIEAAARARIIERRGEREEKEEREERSGQEPRASLRLLLPKKAKTGEKAEIEADISNQGEKEAVFEVVLESEGRAIGRKELRLKPEGRERVRFYYVPQKAGRKRIEAFLMWERKNIASYKDYINIENPEEKEIDVSLEKIKAPLRAEAGKKVKISVYVHNNSQVRSEAKVFLEGEKNRLQQKVVLNPRQSRWVNFSFTPVRIGGLKITSFIEAEGDTNRRNNRKDCSLEVVPPAPKLKIDDLKVKVKKDKAEVGFTIVKDSKYKLKAEAELKVEGEGLRRSLSQRVNLDKERTFVVFALRELKPGEYKLEVDLTVREYKIRANKRTSFEVK